MSPPRTSQTPDPSTSPIERLGREARDSVALVLVTIAVVLTVSFVGIAIS